MDGGCGEDDQEAGVGGDGGCSGLGVGPVEGDFFLEGGCVFGHEGGGWGQGFAAVAEGFALEQGTEVVDGEGEAGVDGGGGAEEEGAGVVEVVVEGGFITGRILRWCRGGRGSLCRAGRCGGIWRSRGRRGDCGWRG